MSVFIYSYNPDTGPWGVVHDDAPGGSHNGEIDPAEITYTTDPMSGDPNHLFATITCPVCQSVSTHPVGGGAQPPLVQELFIRLSLRDGCPCNAPLLATRGTPSQANVQAAHDHVKEHTEEMDGVGRWQVTDEQLAGIA